MVSVAHEHGPDAPAHVHDEGAPTHQHHHHHHHGDVGDRAVARGAALDEPVSGRWAAVLRAHGLRATLARSLILDALQELGHGTPEQLHEAAESHVAGLSLSTVYRTLETMADLGLVTHTHLSAPGKTFMLASHADHAHLVCRTCGAVSTLTPAIGERLADEVAAAHGFRLDRGHVSLFGVCADCTGHAG